MRLWSLFLYSPLVCLPPLQACLNLGQSAWLNAGHWVEERGRWNSLARHLGSTCLTWAPALPGLCLQLVKDPLIPSSSQVQFLPLPFMLNVPVLPSSIPSLDLSETSLPVSSDVMIVPLDLLPLWVLVPLHLRYLFLPPTLCSRGCKVGLLFQHHPDS